MTTLTLADDLRLEFAELESPGGLGAPGADGYADRVELVAGLRLRSCFEFGGHFGHGIITWLHAFGYITWAGWSDNEGAFAGSNAACERNVRTYLERHDRRCELWYCERPIDAAGLKQVDLVMVDGDHSTDATMIDLALAFAMRPKVVLVDDMQLGGVQDAVERFTAYTGRTYEVSPVAAGTAILLN